MKTDQKVFRGRGSAGRLPEIMDGGRVSRVFLVTDPDAFILSGAETALKGFLSGLTVIHFSDFAVNPRIEDIKTGMQLFSDNPCDLIIGVGGGSSLDIAKALSILIEQDGDIRTIIKDGGELNPRRIPTVLIPTTAGTGSEATQFAVVYIEKTKYSLAHPTILADTIFLDPTLTDTMPPYLTATTGMDAFCQAVESFWSVRSTEESRKFSRKALVYILPAFEKAVNNPDDESRDRMLYGSHEAGKAINIAKTTMAHALSYAFTSYFNIPHGHAVALTLPYFFEFNSGVDENSCQDPRGNNFVRARMEELFHLLGVEDAGQAKKLFYGLMARTGLESDLSQMGLGPEASELIIKTGFNRQRAANNPRRVTKEDFRSLMIRLTKGESSTDG